MYLAWKYGGHDPYRLYHCLDEHYVPWDGGEPQRPIRPQRVQQLIYGFALAAEAEEGGKQQRGG